MAGTGRLAKHLLAQAYRWKPRTTRLWACVAASTLWVRVVERQEASPMLWVRPDGGPLASSSSCPWPPTWARIAGARALVVVVVAVALQSRDLWGTLALLPRRLSLEEAGSAWL